jgi:hypothetical protein
MCCERLGGELMCCGRLGGELMYCGRLSSFSIISGIRGVTRVINPGISHEYGKDRVVITTNGTYP